MSEINQQLMEYLEKIAQKSLHGEIPWNQPNPSTFQWLEETDEVPFLVTIQKAEAPRLRKSLLAQEHERFVFLFQVQDRRTKQTLVALSSRERPETFDALEQIYRSAEKGMDVRASNVLQQLLRE